MPEPIEQILAEVKELKGWLYSKNGFEGDIPEIKKLLKTHDKRITRVELVLAGLLGTGLLGGGVVGAFKLIGG